MREFRVEDEINLFRLWVEAQEPITTSLKAIGDYFVINDKIEIRPDEVTLKGKDSFNAMKEFVETLEQSSRLLREGLPKLNELMKTHGSTIDQETLKRIEDRSEHMTAMETCCSEVLEFLHPALQGELNQLVDPNLFEYLGRLHKTYSGDGSKAIEVVVQQTYLI